jgi:hypothetical protein
MLQTAGQQRQGRLFILVIFYLIKLNTKGDNKEDKIERT